jgi:hypothetical protein
VNDDLEVDSAQIAHNLAEHKPEEAKQVIEELDGAYALVWFDERDRSINMCRNEERPLSFTINKDKDMLWFMSDPEHLRVINKSFLNRSSAHGSCIYKLESKRLLKWKKGSLVPEVTDFAPFSYAKRQARERKIVAEKSSGTALENATAKWQSALEKKRGNGNSNSGFTGPRVKLGGMLRKIPEAMLLALRKEYDLTPNDFMEFIPDGSVPFGQDNMVWGTVIYKDWGDSEWRAVLTDAKTIQWNAYKNQSWLVQPIGICHPWDEKSTCPAMMVSLVHCDYGSWKKKQDDEAQAAPKALTPSESHEDDSWVVGPDRELAPASKLRKHVENGCVSCGGNLNYDTLERCIWVNNHQSILCDGCIADFHKSEVPYDSNVN